MSLKTLSAQLPYPDFAPHVPIRSHGWCMAQTAQALRDHLNADTRVVVELGSWLGMSAHFIAQSAPRATVICVDHWCGSVEHIQSEEWRAMLPTLYETFIVNCWPMRERVIPLRMVTTVGLELIASHGVEPDLIYIDAAHDFDSVCRDVTACVRLFPDAILVGDDWATDDVRCAVETVLGEGVGGKRVGHNEAAWWLV